MANNDIGIKIGLDLQTNQGIKDFNDWSNRVQAQAQKKPIKINVDLDGQKWEKTIQTFIAKNGDLVESTKYVNIATKEEYEQITKVENGFTRLQQATAKQVNQNNSLNSSQAKLNSTTKHSVSIFQDFTSTFLKMAKFNTINLIYDGIINKMSEAIQITNDFDAAMTEFKKVTDTTSLSLSDYTEQLGQLGEATARTTTQMLQSATEFSKAGFTPEDSARLAQVASLYQNIADAEISAGEAASFITSQIKAYKDYGVEASNATQIIDKLNEVSNNFSVSSSDIASALTKQSASLAAYGNNLNESIALVTAGTEIMTGQAGKVSRGLRTIGANITQLAQNAKEFDITVNGATKTIQLWNETGTDMLNTYDVLKQISAEWDNMTNAEKSSLAIDLAKKTQMDTFLAVLGNFEDAEKAYTTALLSEGSAWKENEKYMESIEAHQAKLKQAWEELVLSKPIEDLEKSLLNAGTALLKFANSDIAQTLIKVTAFITAMGLLYKTTKAFITLIQAKSATSIFASAITSLIAGEATLTQVTIGLTTAMLSNPLFWGAAAVLGITAIVKVIDAFTVSYEEATEALNDSLATYEQAQSEIESLTSKLEELEKVKSEINEKKLEITDDKQLQELNQQTDELERQEAILQRQLALAKAKAEVAQQDARKAAQDSLTSTVSTESTAVIGYGVVGGRGGTIGTRFEGAITALQSLQEKIIANNRELEVLNQNYDANEDKIKEITAKNEILVQAYEATYKEASTLADTVTDITDALGDETEAYEGSENSLGALLDGLTKLVGWKTDATDKTTEFTSATEDEEDALQEDGEAVNEASNAWDEFLDNIEDVQSAYEILTKAADEYNQNGFITASTLKQLNKLSPEYLAILAQEGDTYENINSALGDYLDKEKEQAIQKVNLARYTSILELCENTLKEQTEKTSKVVEESGTKASEASEGYDELGNAAIKAAIGMKAVEDGGLNTDEFYEKFNKINDYFDGLVDNINKTNLGATKSSKSAAGSSKDAWVEAFKEEQRQLKHSLEMNEITELEYYERLKDLNEKYFGEISGNHQKYIKEYQENEEEIYKGTKAVYDKVKDYLKEAVEQGYEKAINALKREEKAVLAEIKATIDALKREKDETLKGIKRKIDALKHQKEQVQKTYNEEIDKLKEVNDTLQKQNELLEYKQQLQQAKSQKVMVMKGGQFTLSENESAVAEAEKNLAEYEEQTSYEQQIEELEKLRDAEVEYIENKIDSLEKYYDYMESYYDERIQQMEDYYNQVEAQYEKQIEALQTELDAFKEGYKKSEDLDNARLAVEVLAANEEAHIWQQRLDNLANAINAYNTLLDKIGEGEVSGGVFTAATVTYRAVESMANVNTAIPHRAKGDASFKGDEVALVGESPNAELVLGSHLNRSVNSGSLIHLSKGSGVVNAESTATLAGLLNGIVKPNNISNNRSVVQTFTFDNLTLPNVTDSNSFVSALSHKFNNYAIQYGNKR